MINDRPYIPRSQGVIERVLQTIKKSITVNYIQDLQNFNLEEKLPFIINTCNNTIHTVTKYTPTEIIIVLMLNYFKKYIKTFLIIILIIKILLILFLLKNAYYVTILLKLKKR